MNRWIEWWLKDSIYWWWCYELLIVIGWISVNDYKMMMFLLKMADVWWLFDHIWCMIECISKIIFEWWMSECVNMFINRWLWNNNDDDDDGCLSMMIEWWLIMFEYINVWMYDDY